MTQSTHDVIIPPKKQRTAFFIRAHGIQLLSFKTDDDGITVIGCFLHFTGI